MAKIGRPPAIAVEEIEAFNRAEATVADVKARLDSAHATLADVESRMSVAALDALGDDGKAFQAIEAEASKARAAVRQLELAHSEAEKRRDDAERTMRLANARKQIERALKALAERDEAGKRLEAAVSVLAKEWEAMCGAAEKARTLLAGLIPESQGRSGFALGSAELESLLARELWRASGNPMLPGSEKPIRLDGVPQPFTSETAPSLSVNLKDATELARSILGGERDYAGRTIAKPAEPAKPSKWQMPWRHKNDVAIDQARENAARAPIAAMKQEREQHEAKQSAFAAIAGANNVRLPGETYEQWIERVSRPAAPLTDEERAALRPTGTPRSAAEIQAEIDAQGKYSTLIDMRQPKPEEW